MNRQFLEAQLKKAMLAREKKEVSVFRLLLSQIKNREIATKRDLDEDEINEEISREVKKRKEAIGLFEQGKRDDLVAKEKEEMAILEKLLPPAMSNKELCQIIREAVSLEKPKGAVDFGRIMGRVMGMVNGKAAGERVARMVKELISDC